MITYPGECSIADFSSVMIWLFRLRSFCSAIFINAGCRSIGGQIKKAFSLETVSGTYFFLCTGLAI